MPEFDATVEYRPIPDFPGYMIGNDGTVLTERKQRPLKGKGAGRGTVAYLSGEWRMMNQVWGAGSKGYRYLTVSLSKDGKIRHHCVHILVLTVFVGPCPQGMWGRHHDGDRNNNRLDNLSWATPKDNHADRIAHGTHLRGERCGTAKLTADQVRQIRELRQQGWLQKDIASKFKISRVQIQRILNGTRWQYNT